MLIGIHVFDRGTLTFPDLRIFRSSDQSNGV